MPATLDLRRGQVVGDASRRAINLNTLTKAVAGTTYAPIASPVFTGDPKAPTPAPGDNDTSVATTAFVHAAVAAGGATGAAGAVMVGNGAGPLVSSAITSDNGSTLRVSTNQVIGNAVTSPPSHSLVINNAASTPQAVPVAQPLFWVASEGAQVPLGLFDHYGSTGAPQIWGRRSRGTAAAPDAVQASDNLLVINGAGYGTTASGISGQIIFQAVETWNDTAHGTAIAFRTTPNTTTATAEVMRIDHSGNIGIGTTTPNGRFHVKGAAAAGTIVHVVDTGPNGADSTSSMLFFRDFAAAVTCGAVSRTGTNSVTYATTSDARLKESITESKRGLDALMAIKVSDYKMGETASQGLLAQDVATVYPEAVHKGGKDPNLEPWMIDYGRLTPLLIKGFQQQQEMIKALSAKVDALSDPAPRRVR